MTKKILLFTAIACILGSCNLFAITKAKTSKQIENHKYDAYYHWGFIWKKAGSGTLTLTQETAADGTERFHGMMTGRTLSFIEYLMSVRDTIDTYYSTNLIPLEYAKKTHEGSYNAIERNYYTSFPNANLTADKIDSTTVDIKKWSNKKGNDSKRHSIAGPAYDMLSIYYVLRALDFENMKVGEKLKYPIFAGVKRRHLNAKYEGKSTCKLRNGKQYPAYKVLLTFDTKDEDSAPLQVWFSTDPDHRPLSVIVQLKRIGSVQAEIVE